MLVSLLVISDVVSSDFFFFLMIRRPPRSTQSRSSAASDVYKRQILYNYPSNNDTGIDVGSIIAIVFDEAVDNQTLTTNSIKLMEEGLQISFSFQHSKTSDGRSVLCLSLIHISEPTRPY